jgi:hypothetical protein
MERPSRGWCPPSPGSPQSCDEHDGGADDRQPDDEVPRRRRLAESVREIDPDPVLEVVDGSEEERRDERRGDPHDGAERDRAQVLTRGRSGRGRLHGRASLLHYFGRASSL